MKIWDLGGQTAFRSEWLSYAKSCDILIFMIDASNAFFYTVLINKSLMYYR